MKNKLVFGVVAILSTASPCLAEICEGFGPQTPRDISQRNGTNPVKFSIAPKSSQLNLCNIHFHKNAEHKASGFSVSGGEGDHGGWKCNDTDKLKKKQLEPVSKNFCKNVEPGDTIEMHWVHSSCRVMPGEGLGACLSESCANPQLRVETKVFLLVNDASASNFGDYAEGDNSNGYYQAKALPASEDKVQFLGSTTGPKYTEQTCSPLQVTWNVSQSCEQLDINSLSKW